MKDTQGNPITEEEFMKDIGHGVGIKLEEWESEFENLWNEKKGVIDWQTPDNQIKSFIKEERYKGYEEGRDDGFKEGKNAVLSEVEKSFENLHEEYTVDYTNHDILKIINNLK